MKMAPIIQALALVLAPSAWAADGFGPELTSPAKASVFYLDNNGYGLIGLVLMTLLLWIGWRLEQRRETKVDDLVEYLSQTCGWGEDVFEAPESREKRGWAAPLQPASIHFEAPEETESKTALRQGG